MATAPPVGSRPLRPELSFNRVPQSGGQRMGGAAAANHVNRGRLTKPSQTAAQAPQDRASLEPKRLRTRSLFAFLCKGSHRGCHPPGTHPTLKSSSIWSTFARTSISERMASSACAAFDWGCVPSATCRHGDRAALGEVSPRPLSRLISSPARSVDCPIGLTPGGRLLGRPKLTPHGFARPCGASRGPARLR